MATLKLVRQDRKTSAKELQQAQELLKIHAPDAAEDDVAPNLFTFPARNNKKKKSPQGKKQSAAVEETATRASTNPTTISQDRRRDTTAWVAKAAAATRPVDSHMKLTELGHWFDGPAGEIIEAYATMPDSDLAYGTALSRLNNLFGQNSNVAIPLLKQVSSGSSMDKNDYYAHLQLFANIELPHLHDEFWKKDDKLNKKHDRRANFDDFCDILLTRVNILNWSRVFEDETVSKVASTTMCQPAPPAQKSCQQQQIRLPNISPPPPPLPPLHPQHPPSFSMAAAAHLSRRCSKSEQDVMSVFRCITRRTARLSPRFRWTRELPSSWRNVFVSIAWNQGIFQRDIRASQSATFSHADAGITTFCTDGKERTFRKNREIPSSPI